MRLDDLCDFACDACGVSSITYHSRAKLLVLKALQELCSTFRLSQPLVTMTVTPGVGDYSLASNGGVALRDVFYQPASQTQAGAPLQQTSASRIDEIRARTSSNTYPMVFALVGVDVIALAPVPSDAGTLSLRVVSPSAGLSADSDEPATLPDEFHDLVWRGAALELAETHKPDQIQRLAARQSQRLGDLRSWMRDLGGEKPLIMQRRGDAIPQRDPSIYPPIAAW